jgi:hypothetical protein
MSITAEQFLFLVRENPINKRLLSALPSLRQSPIRGYDDLMEPNFILHRIQVPRTSEVKSHIASISSRSP